MSHGRTPMWASSTIRRLTWSGRGRPLTNTPPSWLTPVWPEVKNGINRLTIADDALEIWGCIYLFIIDQYSNVSAKMYFVIYKCRINIIEDWPILLYIVNKQNRIGHKLLQLLGILLLNHFSSGRMSSRHISLYRIEI